jgi:hypothetical protein
LNAARAVAEMDDALICAQTNTALPRSDSKKLEMNEPE